MADPIDFYFDFSSPYGYFAAMRIDDFATRHQRQVRWKPYLMGAAMQITGAQPLVMRDMVRDYVAIDLARTARLYAIPFSLPDPFPVATVAAARAYWWVHDQNNTDIQSKARDFAKALYRAYFVDGHNIKEVSVVLDVAQATGIDRNTLQTALDDDKVKARLKSVTEDAISNGVFGSPYFVVDGEPFWGNDRMNQMDEWLTRGGW
jgi:2-hydroxychromene-2-carboxylate isomerase